MTDIEELIRATLTDARRRLDPPAGLYEDIGEKIGRVRRRRTRRALSAAVGVVAVLVAGGLLVGTHPPGAGPHPVGQGPSPSRSSIQYGERLPLSTIGPGEPYDVVGAGGSFYLAESVPDTLLRLDGGSLAVTGEVSLPGAPQGLTADPAAGRLWARYSTKTGRLLVREYDAALTPLRDVPVDVQTIFAATALRGELWLGTDKGLYRIGAADTTARPVPGLGPGLQIFGLTADPTRGRILVGAPSGDSFLGVRLVAVDATSLAVTQGGTVPLGKEAIAVVRGQIWLGGFASGQDSPRLVRIDPATLQPAGSSPVDSQVGPGAIVWAGESVLWVRNGADEGMSCLDPVTGAILQQWRSVQGPVASVPGHALAVDSAYVVQPVLAGGCRG